VNYYQILQIKQTATQLEIKQAYRRLAKQFHPDSQTDNANHEKIILLNAAYEILSDARNRRVYDQELSGKSAQFLKRRKEKSQAANKYYTQTRQQQQKVNLDELAWVEEVYFPINRFLNLILTPLTLQIDCLSGDPFDDQLMSVFSKYIRNCTDYFEQARLTLISQPNPRKYATIAANLDYCLSHISDGLEELQRFTQTYDYAYLHTGKELFNLAEQLKIESQHTVHKFS
jgi:molecular chaperone DnaJ